MNVGRIIGILIVLVGIGLVVGSGFAYASRAEFLDRAVEVPGTVVDSQRQGADNNGNANYVAVYEYTYEGEERRATSDISKTRKPTIGDEETLLVDPDEPEEIVPDTFSERWLVTLLMLGVGIGLAILGAVFFVVFRPSADTPAKA